MDYFITFNDWEEWHCITIETLIVEFSTERNVEFGGNMDILLATLKFLTAYLVYFH